VYLPGLSVSVQVAFALAATPVFLFTPGPFRWKFWVFDVSETVTLYFFAVNDRTFEPPFLSEIALVVTLPLSLPAGGGGGGGGGGGWTFPAVKLPFICAGMCVADERVGPVRDRHRPVDGAHGLDVGLLIDSRAAQVEVVSIELSVPVTS
jgi:hypothetical protein